MRKFLLPTTELFFEFRHYEQVLLFHDEGVRGVIRDLVLLSTGIPNHDEEAQDLLKYLLEEYNRSIDLRYLENTLRYPNAVAVMVEIAVTEIHQAVEAMMAQYFRNLVYDICKARWQWLGADLILQLDILP